MREPTIGLGHVLGKTFFGALGPFDFLGGGHPPAAAGALAFRFDFAACLLAFLFGANRKRLVDFGDGLGTELFLQLGDAPLRFLQLPLQRGDHFHEPIDTDPPRPHIVLELTDIHASEISDSLKLRCASFTEWTATFTQQALTISGLLP